MTLPTEDVAALVARLRDGLSGVTPGPWVLDGHNLSAVLHCVTPKGHPDAKHLTGDYITVARCENTWRADAPFIAACSPDNIRALLDHIAAQEAAISTLAGERDSAERALLTVQNAAKTIAAAHGTELEHLRQNASFDHSLRAEVESLRQHNSEMTDALLAAEARATTAEAQVVAMREALEPFADAANSYDPDEDDGHTVAWNHDFTLASLRRARTALLAGTPPSGAETQEKVDGN